MNIKSVSAIAFAICAGLSSASLFADPAKVTQATEKTAIVFPDNIQGRPSYLRTIKARYDTPNAKIGELQQGWLCGRTGDIIWSVKLYNLFSPKLPSAFRAELEKAHYPIPKVSDAIFDEPKDKVKVGNELHVGMLIKEVSANLCAKSDGVLGGVYMKIFWQVYAPDAQKVVFETTTEGTYQQEGLDKTQLNGFFEKAFSVAARNLLAEQGFYDVVANTSVAEAKPAEAELLKLKATKPASDSLVKNVTMLRSAVATVSGDLGSGSGFFVGAEGYLLTNYHVVGNAKFVKVKLPTGRELVGEVVRSDKARDVTLVRTEPVGIQPMPVRTSEPNIGEDVFALGSPLGDKFSTSLTRGVLSGYRNVEEKRYLQSDVAILPGNSGGPLLDSKGAVIGITVAGLGAKGLAGMNFFIPINDALARLNVEFN